MYLLDTVALSGRVTTKDRDPVLAVWVGCPRYKVPSNCKQMNLPELLEDTICQLERNWGLSLVTSMPVGLLDNKKQSDGLFWRSSVCQETARGSFEAYNAVGHLDDSIRD
ncbi:hypothetical protein GGS24DRAFT_444929, partial [Hypoxylon argillaceum]